MKDLLTPRQVALAIGVSEASLKRWCDKGMIPAVRTAGGHRRLPLSGVLEFLRENGHPVVRPEVLGLPSARGSGALTIDRTRDLMLAALESGDEESVERLILDFYLSGRTVADVCDRVIAPAFAAIGDRWAHGELRIYEERRGCEVCLRVLHRLRTMLPSIPAGAPRAIGGTIEGDPYVIPTTMVDLALREAGWQAESYGSNLPAATLCDALERVRPRLLWLSVSAIGSAEDFLARYSVIQRAAAALGIPVVVGGNALTDELRREMRFAAHCDTLGHVVAFADSIEPDVARARASRGSAP